MELSGEVDCFIFARYGIDLVAFTELALHLKVMGGLG